MSEASNGLPMGSATPIKTAIGTTAARFRLQGGGPAEEAQPKNRIFNFYRAFFDVLV